MKPDLTIAVRTLYGEPILAGSKNGEAFLPKLIDATNHQTEGAIIALDLDKVELVTASFFRTAFRAFRDYARTGPRLYTIFANSNIATQDEIRVFAEGVGDAFVFASLGRDGAFRSPFVLGKLEDKQAKTLRALGELGEADAQALLERYPEEQVSSSAAWSNRLAALASKGFVVERLEGRLKKFRPIIKGLAYGS